MVLTITKKQILKGKCPRAPKPEQKIDALQEYSQYYIDCLVSRVPLDKVKATLASWYKLLALDGVYTQTEIKKIYNELLFFHYLNTKYDLILVTREDKIWGSLKQAEKMLEMCEFYEGYDAGINSRLVKINIHGEEHYAVGRVVYRKTYQVEFNKEIIKCAIKSLKKRIQNLNDEINEGGE